MLLCFILINAFRTPPRWPYGSSCNTGSPSASIVAISTATLSLLLQCCAFNLWIADWSEVALDFAWRETEWLNACAKFSPKMEGLWFEKETGVDPLALQSYWNDWAVYVGMSAGSCVRPYHLAPTEIHQGFTMKSLFVLWTVAIYLSQMRPLRLPSQTVAILVLSKFLLSWPTL